MLALSLALVATSCHEAAPTLHATGARPTVVSLNPCSDAILAEVAAPGQLLAISHYSHDAASSSMGVAAARRFASVSGSVEEIAALSPDVVVADTFLPPATVAALRDLGIRVVLIGSVNDVAAAEAQVRDLAEAVKNPKAGERLVGRIEHGLASARQARVQTAIPAIVWESGGIVAGDATLIADLLRRTGFANAAAAKGMRQADYLPLEAMLADPPGVILQAGDARSQEDRLLGHPALAALKHTRRVPFDPTLLWCGGPTIVRAVSALQRIRASLPHQGQGA